MYVWYQLPVYQIDSKTQPPGTTEYHYGLSSEQGIKKSTLILKHHSHFKLREKVTTEENQIDRKI